MDRVRAERLEKELAGKQVGGWQIGKLLGNGASAAVFKGERKGQSSALKIIDPELEEKFGQDSQEQRISLEKTLVGHTHPNLIKIYDGGRCEASGFLYIAMEYLPGDTLTKAIPTFPREKIRPIIKQIASAAQFLETMGLAHRDIKPDNVIISSDLEHAILLDLGILRPMAGSDQGTGDAFIGTTRYSPPEFIMREEQDTSEGWRAVTFYQLGALLHDMIMRRRMFSEINAPSAKVIDAVRYINPVIDAADIPPGIASLARSCLTKNPNTRLSLVGWDDFLTEPKAITDLAQLKDTIRRRQITEPVPSGTLGSEARGSVVRKLDQLGHILDALIRDICQQAQTFPSVEIDVSNGASEYEKILKILTGPSQRHGLFVALSVYLKFRLVESETMSIEIDGCALSADAGAEAATRWTSVFKGISDSAEMKVPLDWFLHSCLAAAQGVGSSSAIQTITPSA